VGWFPSKPCITHYEICKRSSLLGVVISIIGIFLIVAASQHNASQAKGLDGVLQELAHQHQPFGRVLLGVVASSRSAGWPS
jgi:hypothetical protein